MSTRPANLASVNFAACSGTIDRNGVDFWWDEQEGQDCIEEQAGCVEDDSVKGNCWDANTAGAGTLTSDPIVLLLPGCPGLDATAPGQQHQAGDPGALRDVEPRDQHGPAGLRLVHASAGTVGRDSHTV